MFSLGTGKPQAPGNPWLRGAGAAVASISRIKWWRIRNGLAVKHGWGMPWKWRF